MEQSQTMNRRQYRTANPRTAGALAACSLETWEILCRSPRRAKACARAAEPKSRALEGLIVWRYGAWGSSQLVPSGGDVGTIAVSSVVRKVSIDFAFRHLKDPGARL